MIHIIQNFTIEIFTNSMALIISTLLRSLSLKTLRKIAKNGLGTTKEISRLSITFSPENWLKSED